VSRTRLAARWRAVPEADAAAVAALQAGLRALTDRAGKPALPDALVRLLALKGMRAVDEAARFLKPQREHLTPPEALTDLRRAAERLADALRARERIMVHGDYDVDGICSTALLTDVLRGLGGDVLPFIPERNRDGYDLGPAGVRAAVEGGANVVLTCDCGTKALEPARALARQGIALIITDHHRPGSELPPAYAVVNPQREPDADTRGDRHCAAVGIAWKLAQVVTDLVTADWREAERAAAFARLDDQLALVALATVADVAALVGDNRVLVAEGLRRMAPPKPGVPDRRNRGLQALIRSAGIDDKRLTAGQLGFRVAPRLNALGRIRHALLGVELLLATDEGRAMDLAAECNRVNDERRVLDQRMLDEAQQMLVGRDLNAARGLVLHGEGWEPGVIGVVAARIVELTHRPTFLIAVTSDGGRPIGKGSGRSVAGFDLHAALTSCGDLLEKYGGHRAAAGLTIDPAHIGAFAERFDAAAAAALTEEQLVPEYAPDLELPIDAADESLLAAMRFLEPFGVGNAGPLLLSRGVQLRGGPRKIGTDGLKFEIASAGGPREAVGWGLAARSAEIERDARVDLVYRLGMNEFRGARTLQATIEDLRPSRELGEAGSAPAMHNG
jgi:single-stranded-DNA-specific exonuclease